MKKIALVGNPNCGKTTLFNVLTGLNQKVGNFPGVTVEKRTGKASLPNGDTIDVVDLPGTYSLSSTSPDEKVVQDVLLNPKDDSYPDLIVLVLDISNLKRNLFLASQIIDLGIPVVMALNMLDIAQKKGFTVDQSTMIQEFGVPVVSISAKTGEGIDLLKEELTKDTPSSNERFVDIMHVAGETLDHILDKDSKGFIYRTYKILNNYKTLKWLESKDTFSKAVEATGYNSHEAELHEISHRYERINEIIEKIIRYEKGRKNQEGRTEKLDKLVTHPFYGLLIFIAVFFLLFQSVFTLAQYPMEWITEGMGWVTESLANNLPESMWSDFLTEGILAGIAGVLVFLPQIMILFGLITILEDSGYLSRVSFMSDKLLRTFGMNGKSVIPLVGGFACAVPAIMAARSIDSKRERLITIFVTPLMSCSARLPVYVFLTAFIVPNKMLLGFISLQGLFMMGLYLLGIIFSLVIALIANKFLKNSEHSTFLLELPKFRVPTAKNVFTSMTTKGKTFIMEAGKIILIASVILWFLSSYGPSSQMERIEEKYSSTELVNQYSEEEIEAMMGAEKLEYSYIGYFGKTIEPVIEPLGFDWKVGIALISSFAAREVFVGTMSTIYSVESGKNSKDALDSIHFSMPTAFSLLIFYVFALQCLSTIAIAKQETKSWKFALIQLGVFTLLAYVCSFITYQLLS